MNVWIFVGGLELLAAVWLAVPIILHIYYSRKIRKEGELFHPRVLVFHATHRVMEVEAFEF